MKGGIFIQGIKKRGIKSFEEFNLKEPIQHLNIYDPEMTLDENFNHNYFREFSTSNSCYVKSFKYSAETHIGNVVTYCFMVTVSNKQYGNTYTNIIELHKKSSKLKLDTNIGEYIFDTKEMSVFNTIIEEQIKDKLVITFQVTFTDFNDSQEEFSFLMESIFGIKNLTASKKMLFDKDRLVIEKYK